MDITPLAIPDVKLIRGDELLRAGSRFRAALERSCIAIAWPVMPELAILSDEDPKYPAPAQLGQVFP